MGQEHKKARWRRPVEFPNICGMENAARGGIGDEKSEILKRIEAIGNRESDALDSSRQLQAYLDSAEPEVVLSALQAAGGFVSDRSLFDRILAMAAAHPDEEIRGMAASCLGNVIFDGLEYEEDLPDETEAPAPLSDPEFYGTVKSFLFSRIDALMESMEVRRRVLEALGYLAWKPEVREIVLRFYREAPNPWVKVSALYAMGLVRDPVFERILLEELYSPNEHILIEAAHASHMLQLRAAEKRLEELTRHPSVDVRYEAVVALGTVGNLERLPALLRGIEAENKDSSDIAEALEHARSVLKQRSMMQSGDGLWDDQRVLDEIDEMLDNPNAN
jgi:HEAT repeat protein